MNSNDHMYQSPCTSFLDAATPITAFVLPWTFVNLSSVQASHYLPHSYLTLAHVHLGFWNRDEMPSGDDLTNQLKRSRPWHPEWQDDGPVALVLPPIRRHGPINMIGNNG